jgi:tetrahydromethanopterin S-methyltransferase subunit F
MQTKLASALGLALLAASLTFGSSFACPDTPGITASALATAPEADAMDREYLPVQRSATEAPVAEVEQPTAVASVTDRSSTEVAASSATPSIDAIVAEVTQNVTLLARESDAAQAGMTEISPAESNEPAAVTSAIEPSSIDVSTPPAIQSFDAIVVEITETATVVGSGQRLEDNEHVQIMAPIIISKSELSFGDLSSQTAASESETKATGEFSAETDIAKAQTEEVAYPAPDVAENEPASIANSTIESVDATPVEIMGTMTAAVSVQKTESQDVEITGPVWEPAVAEPDTAVDNLE